MGRLIHAIVALSLVACATTGTPRPEGPAESARASFEWQPWSAESFERARRENKLILVSVQAGWCHWCHVMNRVTYADSEVARRIDEGYVAIRVDADARPDLAERYSRWAWPATALLTPDAQPITEMRGHQPPRPFARLLGELTAERESGRPIARRAPRAAEPEPELSDLETLRDAVRAQLDGLYDRDAHGWGTTQKYPFAAPVEHALFRAEIEGDAAWRARALSTLEGHAQLIDPVWGGMYQYSLEGRWDAPHYEKITEIQAGAIHNFAQAHRITGDPRWLDHARAVVAYTMSWLRDPQGGFYTSQDADVGTHGAGRPMTGDRFYALPGAERRRAGAPHVDRSVYANLNGLMIRALAELYQATLDRDVLDLAVAAADRILRTHAVRGGFSHGDRDSSAVLHLADQVEMARGLLALHQVTGEARYLGAASDAMTLVRTEMAAPGGGFYAHTVDPEARGVFAERRIPIHHNAVAARVLLALYRIEGEQALHDGALAAVRAVGRPDALRVQGRKVGEYLLALEELRAPYAIFSVVGPAGDPETAALHRAALRFHHPTRLVELGRPGASRYPYPGAPAVYLCTASACSMPIADPVELPEAARRFLQR